MVAKMVTLKCRKKEKNKKRETEKERKSRQ